MSDNLVLMFARAKWVCWGCSLPLWSWFGGDWGSPGDWGPEITGGIISVAFGFGVGRWFSRRDRRDQEEVLRKLLEFQAELDRQRDIEREVREGRQRARATVLQPLNQFVRDQIRQATGYWTMFDAYSTLVELASSPDYAFIPKPIKNAVAQTLNAADKWIDHRDGARHKVREMGGENDQVAETLWCLTAGEFDWSLAGKRSAVEHAVEKGNRSVEPLFSRKAIGVEVASRFAPVVQTFLLRGSVSEAVKRLQGEDRELRGQYRHAVLSLGEAVAHELAHPTLSDGRQPIADSREPIAEGRPTSRP